MGKPAFLHRRQQKDKRFLSLVGHCRNLRQKDHMTLEGLCLYHFGQDGPESQRIMRALLKKVYFTLWDNQRILFGPIRLPPDPFYYYVVTQTWEKKQILERYMKQADGVLRRVLGDDNHKNIANNWVNTLGQPMHQLLLGHRQIERGAKELMPPLETCLNCQVHFYNTNAKFCPNCGAKL